MGTADPHLGQPKSPNEIKSRPKWSSENQGPTTIPRGRGKGSISRGSVDLFSEFKIIN